MNDHHDELAAALHRLRGEVRERVPMPGAARLRARAIREQRVRRTTAVLAAAAAFAALVLGGGTLLNTTAGRPEPPADAPTPSSSPIPPAPTMPSPRPEPRPEATIDDPIADVDWRNATFAVDGWEGCPAGATSFVPYFGSAPPSAGGDWAIGPADSYPAMLLDVSTVTYGDLAADDRLEAIMLASCAPDGDGIASGHNSHLIIVSRNDDGTLSGRGWAGPDGAAHQSWWVDSGRLLMSVDLWSPDPPDLVPTVPGQALAYEWQGERGFVGGDPAPGYPPIVPFDLGETGPPVRLRAVAGALGCPDVELRFGGWPVGSDPAGTASVAGATYAIQSGPGQPYLFDLDNTGSRLLVVGLACTRADRSTGQGLAVLERSGEGWQGISLLTGPDGERPVGWGEEADGDRFTVEWAEGTREAYRWNGTELTPVDD